MLLCGQVGTAEKALAAAFADLEENLGQLRGEAQRRVWMAMRIRQHSLAQPVVATAPRLLRSEHEGESLGLLKIEAYIFAQHFSRLAEPERSALALYHLELFSIEEIAALLSLDVEGLCAALGRARKNLRALLERQPEPALTHA